MTCFWDGIVRSLDENDYKKLSIQKTNSKIQNITNIINSIKNMNSSHNISILWQGKEITNKEKQEIHDSIKEYNIRGIQQGHLTSFCDPFLCFIASFLYHRIHFSYMNHKVIFEPKETNKIRKDVFYSANNRHFVFHKLKNI